MVSVGLISNAGYSVIFKDGVCTIRDPSNTVIGRIPKQHGLYKVDRNSPAPASANTASDKLTIMDAHRRLGHISPDAIKALACEGTVSGLDLLESSLPLSCNSCIYGKMTCEPSPKERTGCCANNFGGEVHTDMWGPSPIKSLGGKMYYISFTDDKT